MNDFKNDLEKEFIKIRNEHIEALENIDKSYKKKSRQLRIQFTIFLLIILGLGIFLNINL